MNKELMETEWDRIVGSRILAIKSDLKVMDPGRVMLTNCLSVDDYRKMVDRGMISGLEVMAYGLQPYLTGERTLEDAVRESGLRDIPHEVYLREDDDDD